ncbi:MAG: hypothetical protein FJZ00_08300, partial [Candidatus Sericytochromatia bacterium]|nr:hypothetical protein [Candidatus Tanganyikabacteria bacterium]
MRFSALLLTVSLALAGCGKAAPGVAASPEDLALVATRADAQDGLRYQRTRLGSDEIRPGLGADDLYSVASNYRVLASRIAGRTKGLSPLKAIAADVDRALAYEKSLVRQALAGAATYAAIVEEYQGTFKGVSATVSGKMGRKPPGEREDDLIWNPHVGR